MELLVNLNHHFNLLVAGTAIIDVGLFSRVALSKKANYKGASQQTLQCLIFFSFVTKIFLLVIPNLWNLGNFNPWIDGVLYFDTIQICLMIWSLIDTYDVDNKKENSKFLDEVDYAVLGIVGVLYSVISFTHKQLNEIYEMRVDSIVWNIVLLILLLNMLCLRCFRAGIDSYFFELMTAFRPKDQTALTHMILRIPFYFYVYFFGESDNLLFYVIGVFLACLINHCLLFLEYFCFKCIVEPSKKYPRYRWLSNVVDASDNGTRHS